MFEKIKYRLLGVFILQIASIYLYLSKSSSTSPLRNYQQDRDTLAVKSINAGNRDKLRDVLKDKKSTPIHRSSINKGSNSEPYETKATKNPPPQDVNFLINNPNICTNSSGMKYIVYVHSAPENTARRHLLRSTWLNTTFFTDRIMRAVFVFGRSNSSEVQANIETEAERYGDIIQGDFIDTYRNLTLKAVLGLKWVMAYCKEASILIKVDDDAFVNIFKLFNLLRSYEGSRRTIVCLLYKEKSMPILRDPLTCAKWCVQSEEFPGRDFYPRYCAGLAYILSIDLVPLLYNASWSTPFFWIDDVYVTGLLPQNVEGVRYISLVANYTFKVSGVIKKLKNSHKSLTHIFVHAPYPSAFMSMWQLLIERTDNSALSERKLQ